MSYSKLSNIPGLNHKSKALINIHDENTKSIIQTEHYISNAFNILSKILDSLTDLEFDLYNLNIFENKKLKMTLTTLRKRH